MGRPSIAEQRTREILDAFARCVARQGLEATSMQDVADEAGVKRPILRHYVGNRADLVAALAEHVSTRYRAHTDELVASLPEERPLDAALPLLFPVEPTESAADILVLESLIAAADTDDAVREPMLGYVDHTLAALRGLVRRQEPGASRTRQDAVAYGILSLWFNHTSLTPLRPAAGHRRAALAAAKALLAADPST